MRLTWILLVVLTLSIAPLCSASIFGVAGGKEAPDPTLGSYSMTPFPYDDRPHEEVSYVVSPLGGEVSFDTPLRINDNSGWTSTANPYTGKIYFTWGSFPSSMTLTLPSNTVAFYLYATTNWYSPPPYYYEIIATAYATSADGTSLSTSLTQETKSLGGATYYGFYADSGEFLTKIELNVDGDYGFILGEFGIAKASTTPPEITVNIENAKVCWDHSDIHLEGKLYIPQGFWMNNLNPVGSAVIKLAGDEVADQSVDFEIAGKKDDKWEYKDKENFYGNLKEFKIDWKGAKFDYKGNDKFHIHTHFISGTETTLCIHTGDVSGAFTVTINGTTIAYDDESNITTIPTDLAYEPQKEDNSHVIFTLLFELTSEMTIEASGAIPTINVADHYEEGFVKFKLISAFDPDSSWDSSDDELKCVISLGDMIAGSDLIDAWTNKDDKHWEYK